MSSDEFRPPLTDEISDLATAKLSLRWALEKVHQMDEEMQKISHRLIAKEDEVSKLSKELAHQSTVAINEKDITYKTQQLLDEYRGMMGASLDQLWKKYAPQEADAKKKLQDQITSLEHDLGQMSRLKSLNDENIKKAEENLARAERERLELVEELRNRENEVVLLREKVVSLEPAIQKRYDEKLTLLQEEFTHRLGLQQERIVQKERDLQERLDQYSRQLERDRALIQSDSDRRYNEKKQELESQRQEWLKELDNSREAMRRDLEAQRHAWDDQRIGREKEFDNEKRAVQRQIEQQKRELEEAHRAFEVLQRDSHHQTEQGRRDTLAELAAKQNQFDTYVRTESERLSRLEAGLRDKALQDKTSLETRIFEEARQRETDMEVRYNERLRTLETAFAQKDEQFLAEKKRFEAEVLEKRNTIEKDREDFMLKLRQEREIWEAQMRNDQKRLQDLEQEILIKASDEQKLWQAKTKEDSNRIELLERDLMLKVENEKMSLQQRAEEVSQQLEQLEAESQKRIEQERVSSQAKIEADNKKLEQAEKQFREKIQRDEARLRQQMEDTLRMRQEELENKVHEDRLRIEKEQQEFEERVKAERLEWLHQHERAMLDLDGQRLALEEEKASLEARRKKHDQEFNDKIEQELNRISLHEQAEKRRLAEIENALSHKHALADEEKRRLQAQAIETEEKLRAQIQSEHRIIQQELEEGRRKYESLEKDLVAKVHTDKQKHEQALEESFARRTAEIERVLQEKSSKTQLLAEEERKQYARMLESQRAEMESHYHEKELALARERQDFDTQKTLAQQALENEKKTEMERIASLELKLKKEYETLTARFKESHLLHEEEWEKRKIQMEAERKRIQSLEAEMQAASKAKEDALLFQQRKEEERLFELEKTLTDQNLKQKRAWEETMQKETQRLEQFEKDLRSKITMEQKNWELKADESHRRLSLELEDLWKKRAHELELQANEKEEEREKAFEEMKRALIDQIQNKENELKQSQDELVEERQAALGKLLDERKNFEAHMREERKKLESFSSDLQKRIQSEQESMYGQMEDTLKKRTAELEALWQEKSTRSQRQTEEQAGQRYKIVAEKQAALEALEKKYQQDMVRLESDYASRVRQLEAQRDKWAHEHDETLQRLEEIKQKTMEQGDMIRLAAKKKEEDFEAFKKSVEEEWPIRLEKRVREITDKARHEMSRKEEEFADARKRWLDETTQMKMNLSEKMTELQESYSQKEQEMQRRYLQKEHDLTQQMEKTMSDLHNKQLDFESKKSHYEKLAEEAGRSKEEMETAKKDLQNRVQTLTQEFLHQQSVMDEQMRRLQNEKHDLKAELEKALLQSRQSKAA